ncbi:malto-oligosyltrehalose synthase, partial [Burkholderia pseudomallei]
RDYAAARGPGALDAVLHGFDPRIARSREMLHRLLEQQHYRLAWWRTATDEINWRRFFDISTLACMRIEDAAVFDDVHALLWRLYAAGLVDGVRIDHVDGLADPRGYCRQLRGRLAALRDGEPYIVVEKILAPDERLPEDWRVDGTTGYDFMNDVSALLHDAAGAAPLAALWADMTGAETTFAREALDGKRRVLARQFAAEHERVARAMHRLARASRDARDFALNPIRRAVAELAIRLPVYRLYPSAGAPQRTDRALLAGAWQAARSAIAPAARA